MRLTWLGHSAFHIQAAGKDILIDPFFTGNPTFPAGYEDKLERVDHILLTHGHEDHLGDTERLAKAHGATVVAMFEIANYLGGKGVEKLEPMAIGGRVKLAEGLAVSMVQAFHSSSVEEEGGRALYLGNPTGLIVEADETVVYHAGDTGIFSDMQLIQRLYEPRIGLIPIGDRFTMGPEMAAVACNEFLNLEVIVPIHWGTFDLLTGDPQVFDGLVERGEVRVLQPGEGFEA